MLADSKPLQNVEHGKNLRYIASVHKKKLYGKYTNSSSRGKYVDRGEIAVRNFLKGLFATPPLFNLTTDVFLTRLEVLEFLQNYQKDYKYTYTDLARYKDRDVKLIKMKKCKECDAFVAYVKTKFSDFDEEMFYSEST